MTEQDSEHDRVATLVHHAAPRRFDDGFADRVLAHVRSRRDSAIGAALERQFLRIVPLVAAAALVLAAYNWWGGRTNAASALDAALNLPQVTLSSAYTPSALYSAPVASDDQ